MKEESLLLLSDLQKLINQVVLIDYTIIILGGEMMNDTFMKEKPVLPLILSMAMPMVLSMLLELDLALESTQ